MTAQSLRGRAYMVEIHYDGTSLVRLTDRGVPVKEVSTSDTTTFLDEMAALVDRFAEQAPPARWSRRKGSE